MFDEVKNTLKVHTGIDCQYIIYKGFKLTKLSDGSETIQDARFCDFYSKVKPKDKRMIDLLGFIEGANYICNMRNTKRVKTYENKVINLYKKLNDTDNTEKRKLIRRNINKNLDLMFLYKSRVTNFKNEENGIGRIKRNI